MTKEEALALLNQKLKNKNLIKHSLAVEAVMRELAKHFQEDEELWGMAGLLHDLDYEETADECEKHGIIVQDWLKEYDIDPEIFSIIEAHNSDALMVERKTLAEKAIYAADPLTGLITATALMTPDKKLKDVSIQSLMKKFKNKGFAQGANRDQIRTSTDLGLDLETFLALSLKAMQSINQELGL